jgi:predicted O-methyltransferase YrrM
MRNTPLPILLKPGRNKFMHSRFRLGIEYLKYLVTAQNGRGHGIHSPFVYELVRNVFMDRKPYAGYTIPEQYRKMLLQDGTVLDIEDMGAGSVLGMVKKRKVSDIAGTSVKHRRYSQLLYRLAAYYKYKRILELGTSLGVTTSYLAAVPGVEQVVTIEGASTVADLAQRHFDEFGMGQVQLIKGGFDVRLEDALEGLGGVDLAFIDGNHKLEPTLHYFESIIPRINEYSCMVFDDIHWSEEMEGAWEKICKDDRVTLSIDLFFIGLVFFRKEFREKQHFVIRY